MSQSIITTAFEAYKAEQEYLQQPVALDEFVLAFVPGQDPTAPIDPNEGLPPAEQIVYVAPVTQDGYVNPNAVAYSLIMDTRVGDFEFNWVGLRNKANGIIAAITHVPAIHKYKSIPGVQNGNSVTRSILMSYQNAKSSTGINVDASTWQIDFTARLYGIEENERLVNLDVFGHGAFLGDGFKIAKSGETYTATNGRAYVGGLRCHLDTDTPISGVLPNRFIYLDASWQGQLISQNQTVFEIVVSDTELSDYVSEDGYQHYLTKIAETDDWGNPVDHRYLEGFAQYYQKHELDQLLNLKVDKRVITHDINSTSSSNVASGKAVGDVKRLLDSHKSEGNPHPQYWHNDEVASNAEAIAGTSNSRILTALRGMEQLKSRISSSLSGARADYAASESALKAAYDLAASKITQAFADGRYLKKAEKAADTNLFDGLDSSAFSRTTHTHTAQEVGACTYAQAQAYTNQEISKLLGGAPSSALDTIYELGEALLDQEDAAAAMNTLISNHKADKNNPHGVNKNHIGLSYVNNWPATSATNSTSATTYATAAGVKAAYDRGSLGVTNAANAHARASDAYILASAKWSAVNASTTVKGIVQLSTSVSSTSTTLAATASAAKIAYDRGTLGINNASTAKSRADAAYSLASGKWSVVNGSTSAKGIVQLSTSVSSTSTTLAATASAVKSAYDRATLALNTANSKWGEPKETILFDSSNGHDPVSPIKLSRSYTEFDEIICLAVDAQKRIILSTNVWKTTIDFAKSKGYAVALVANDTYYYNAYVGSDNRTLTKGWENVWVHRIIGRKYGA